MINNRGYNVIKDLKPNKTKEINLSNLKIDELGNELISFEKLVSLNLFNNSLKTLPISFEELKNLEILNLGNNHFKVIPESIVNLPIKSLNLSSNSISDLSGLNKLSRTIEKLDLSFNKLTVLRMDFTQFHSIKNLNLCNNGIRRFPRSITSESLRTLNLSHNLIDSIPASIGELKGLIELDLSYNNLDKLPEEVEFLTNLRVLKLTGNNLTHLPKGLGKLKKLKELILTGNPIGLPPVEVANQGVLSIINYYLHIGQFVRLNEAKLLIVGQGNVGKTHLLNKVVKDTLPDGGSTKGIDIVKWVINDQHNNPIRVNIWDFGGQEIYHSTHQFFLTQRSIYVFVWEARKDENILQFDYWLNIIKTLSNGSPVFVVMNKVDDRSVEIDEKTIKEAFPNVIGFYKTSALNGHGVNELSAKMKSEVLNLPHIGDKLPKVWNDVRSKLESLELNYISYDDYAKVCAQFGLDHNEAKIVSKYLHDLGVFIHFRGNRTLKTMVFLNPEWVTNSVYKILDMVEVSQNKGFFTTEFIEKKLTERTHNEISYILTLMEMFELCFELKKGEFIIPELLSPTEPEVKDLDMYSEISLSYKYDFMPAGIVTRLTVRLKEMIYKNYFWRNGVYLTYKDSFAVVESKDILRSITIKVHGKNSALLLELIKNDIDQINSTLNHPSHRILIQCNCGVCRASTSPYMYEFDFLMRAKEKFNQILCQKSLFEINISELVGPYEIKGDTASLDLLYNPDSLLFDLVEISTRLTERKYLVKLEDLVTDNFSDQLRAKGYNVSDQTRSGRSSTGMTSGELDLMIRDSRGLPISIIESFRLDSFGMGNTTIIEHLTKLQVDYDTTGLPVNFMIVYSESENFMDAWNKYVKYISKLPFHRFYDPKLLELTDFGVNTELSRRNNIKVLFTSHSKELGVRRDVYHIFVDLSNKDKSIVN